MRRLLATLTLLLATAQASAQTPSQPREVDVELVLAVDASRSVAASELILQRRGYAEALMSPQVQAAIQAGLLGEVAIRYVEWAGDGTVREIVPWRTVATLADAEDVAALLMTEPVATYRRTSISGVLREAARSMRGNGFAGLRKVIDISGDGPNNDGRFVEPARDAVLAEGIIINGLPLMTRVGADPRWHIEDLDLYYRDCVIGGPGAFMIPVRDWTEFEAAVRRKLVLEIAGRVPAEPERLWQAEEPARADCQIGEKIWQRWFGGEPW